MNLRISIAHTTKAGLHIAYSVDIEEGKIDEILTQMILAKNVYQDWHKDPNINDIGKILHKHYLQIKNVRAYLRDDFE